MLINMGLWKTDPVNLTEFSFVKLQGWLIKVIAFDIPGFS